jgi:hypothetical protein
MSGASAALPDAKFCHYCGNLIARIAEICPKCGVRQPAVTYNNQVSDDIRRYRTICSITLLVSAIFNIVFGFVWLATCFGVVLTVPMIVLCIFEFSLYNQVDSLSVEDLAKRVKGLGIFEIVVGLLLNIPSLICGIINIITSDQLRRIGG